MEVITQIGKDGISKTSLVRIGESYFQFKTPLCSNDIDMLALMKHELNISDILRDYSNEYQYQKVSNRNQTIGLILPFYKEGSLSNQITELLLEDKVFHEGRAVIFVYHLMTVLDFAHKRGIVHRCVTPSNIMLNNGGPVLFGWHHASYKDYIPVDSIDKKYSIYRSPNSLLNEFTYLDDYYSCGKILAELITGNTEGKPENKRVADIITKLSDPNPDKRYQDFRDFHIDTTDIFVDYFSHGISSAPDFVPISTKNRLQNDYLQSVN